MVVKLSGHGSRSLVDGGGAGAEAVSPEVGAFVGVSPGPGASVVGAAESAVDAVDFVFFVLPFSFFEGPSGLAIDLMCTTVPCGSTSKTRKSVNLRNTAINV